MAELKNIDTEAGKLTGKEKIFYLIQTAWQIRRSHPKESINYSLQARELSEQLNFTQGTAYTFRNTGTAYYILSQYNQGLTDLEKALSLFKQLHDQHAIGTTLRNMGNIHHAMGLSDLALQCYFQALEITKGESDIQGTAYNLGNIGHVYQKNENYTEAKKYLLEAKSLLENIKDELGLSDLLNNLGNVLLFENDTTTALKYFNESLAIATSIKHLRGKANAHLSLGNYYLGQNDIVSSIAQLEESLLYAKHVGELRLVAEALKDLSVAYEKSGNLIKAFQLYKEYDVSKSLLQKTDRELLTETFKLKSEIEKANLENELYKNAIAELEKAQKQLERLSLVASETENPILILDGDGTLDWVNASFERLNGCTMEEFKKKRGNTIYELSNNPKIKNIIQECIDTKSSVRYESPNYLENGTTVWEASTLTPIFNSDGKLSKLIIIDDDITERKMNEETIKQKNKDITDSILYAKRLQEALLPPISSMTDIFKKSFIVFKPKDIVSGDFYWFSKTQEVSLMALADCTGHGVPGALMSVIGSEMLSVSLHHPSVRRPSEALDMLDAKIKDVFKKGRTQNDRQDGMDIGLLVWHNKTNLVQYAGAKRPLVHIRNGVVKEYAGDRFSIGGKDETNTKHFKDHEFYVEPGDLLYLFTDGYSDQFGGPKGKKFMYKNFIKMLAEISPLDTAEQKNIIEKRLTDWIGRLEQVDDISVIGIRIV
ncbi:MAG: hypothetical protein JWO32_1841 [Bacteroidetes bacterium]|nr:hypothetical protein [Bacteroidota bacterium]